MKEKNGMLSGIRNKVMKYSVSSRKRIIKLGWPFVVLFLLAIIVFRERMGLKPEEAEAKAVAAYGDRIYQLAEKDFSESSFQQTECLILMNSQDEQSLIFAEDMELILGDMKTGYEVCDLADGVFPVFEDYGKIIITLSDLSVMGENIVDLCDWVADGGQLMNTGTFLNSGYFSILAAKAGVLNGNNIYYSEVGGMRILDDFMINAQDKVFRYDEPSYTAMNLDILAECKVYIEEPDSGIPLLWEKEYGQGKFVMMNQVLTGKVNRGILSAAYSLLGDISAYPVINASAYYIDDFPSPVPSGNGTYITKEYGVNISNFYSNIWWPDMLELEDKYGIFHTGLIIEEYSDQVKGPFQRNTSTERFTFFGNMLLNEGGELGIHGYNHMPLCLEDYDYGGLYDSYEKWESVEDMKEAITEVKGFSQNIFKNERFAVYVPPSNVLSEQGREALKESLPELRVIASTYFEGTAAYTQEYEVAEDGIIETPRITSGCNIDEYMMLAAFSELNFHYVQSHFLHPDDVLDEDRGAALGWGRLYEILENYIKYICEAAPSLRNLTGSGMAEAVREFDKLSVERIEKEGELTLNLGGMYQDAYLMVRINKGMPEEIIGGSLQKTAENLYLLHAQEEQVIIRYR